MLSGAKKRRLQPISFTLFFIKNISFKFNSLLLKIHSLLITVYKTHICLFSMFVTCIYRGISCLTHGMCSDLICIYFHKRHKSGHWWWWSNEGTFCGKLSGTASRKSIGGGISVWPRVAWAAFMTSSLVLEVQAGVQNKAQVHMGRKCSVWGAYGACLEGGHMWQEIAVCVCMCLCVWVGGGGWQSSWVMHQPLTKLWYLLSFHGFMSFRRFMSYYRTMS